MQAPIYHSSKVAISRNADTFIWWLESAVVGCFNSEPTGPVRAATIKRWISMAAAQQCDVDALVRPTEIEHVGIMRYEANIWQTAGIPGPLAVPPIPDQEILSPGDYVCIPRIPFRGKGAIDPMPYHPEERFPLADVKRDIEHALLDELPEDFARQKDTPTKQCFLTGTSSDIEVGWIFPPRLSGFLFMRNGAEVGIPRGPRKTFSNLANVVAMRKDLFILFDGNTFSIDVDDDLKVIRFTAAAMTADLPEKLDASKVDKEMIPFLRAHFHWTLSLHFYGGGIEDEYPMGMIRDFEVEVNLDDPDGPHKPFTDAAWDTPMGRDAKKLLQKHEEPERGQTVKVYDSDGNFLGSVNERDLKP